MDYIRPPDVILYGTHGDDEFFIGNQTQLVFGNGGNNRMRTPADDERQDLYNDLPLPDRPGHFSHPVPAGTTMTYAEHLWSTASDWTVDVGERDTVKSGYGHLTEVLHGAFRPYLEPTHTYGVNLDAGSRDNDRFIFNHDNISTHAKGHADPGGATWTLDQLTVVGISADSHDNGITLDLNFGTDGRGPGVDRFTGAGDHIQHIPRLTDSLQADASTWAHDHDHVTHPGGYDFLF